MTIKEAKTGGLIKEIIELRKYEKKIIKELDKRYKKSTPFVKRKIKELKYERKTTRDN